MPFYIISNKFSTGGLQSSLINMINASELRLKYHINPLMCDKIRNIFFLNENLLKLKRFNVSYLIHQGFMAHSENTELRLEEGKETQFSKKKSKTEQKICNLSHLLIFICTKSKMKF